MALSEKGRSQGVEDGGQTTGSEDRSDGADNGPRLDHDGLPLSPQPSSDPMDPLNWSKRVKLMVLAEISVLSFLALLSASLIVRYPPVVSADIIFTNRHCRPLHSSLYLSSSTADSSRPPT